MSETMKIQALAPWNCAHCYCPGEIDSLYDEEENPPGPLYEMEEEQPNALLCDIVDPTRTRDICRLVDGLACEKYQEAELTITAPEVLLVKEQPHE